ncbi:hypothetical protein H2200_002696 [Cladophialophora chaetospira]|uniref:Amine oxidase domain-containing protein n=1 Tax=Cladophialophora chaetospira TaxID=386627 RepID=A0AA39CN99_9EURO|nr:hypothetical protein H2200_002696 [Cladophialophora chaetospira]
MASSKIPHVAVIGAGIAGLRCSDVLARSGVRVTLFEARDRIGGRVHQLESGGHLMDMGPNWIHGTKGNPIMHLAEKTGTVVMEPEENQALFDTEGKRRSDAEAVDLSSKLWEMIVDAFKYSDEQSAEIDPQLSLYEFFKSKLDEEKGLDRRKRDDLLHEAQMWGPFVGDAVERQSLKFFFLEECIEGENVFVASTYKNILKEVGRTATNKEKVNLRLQTPVAHFDTTHSEDNKVTITTSSGEKATFDDIIVTCPLGWLKHNHVNAFTPPLPPRLAAAISSITYGRLEKLYVTFPSAFWLSPSNDQNDPADLSSYPIFTHFHDPTYVPHAKDEAWNQSVVSLAHLPPPASHSTLLFYIYGACGTHLVNSIKDLPQHSEEYNTKLNTFAHPFYSLLPNYNPTTPSCKPTSFLATTWQADPFAGNGSYCNFQIGFEHGDEDIECMRDAGGLTDQGLWLAGEHTAPFIALGTTTGAWWSGEGVARRICKKYGIDVAKEEDAALEVNGVNGEIGKKELDKEKMDGANLSGLAI